MFVDAYCSFHMEYQDMASKVGFGIHPLRDYILRPHN